MSHVDDGMLHAYLDGELAPVDARGVDAHMAQCPDCRRRLDEERALIARAAELLALATPPDRLAGPDDAADPDASSHMQASQYRGVHPLHSDAGLAQTAAAPCGRDQARPLAASQSC